MKVVAHSKDNGGTDNTKNLPNNCALLVSYYRLMGKFIPIKITKIHSAKLSEENFTNASTRHTACYSKSYLFREIR